MSDDFSHKPFGDLSSKVKVEHKAATPLHKRASKSKASPALPPSIDDDDSAMFLSAVRTTNPAAKKSPTPDAFTMHDISGMKTLAKKGKQSSKKKNNTVSSTDSPLTEQPQSRQTSPRPHGVDDDAQAFLKAMVMVEPLVGKGRDVAPEITPSTALHVSENALQDFMDGKLEFALALTGEYLEGHVVGLDDITMNKLRAGQFSPEAHLDLHGLNAMQAYQALVGFFRSAWYKGLRTVLVVPGRGKNSPDGIGILREKLQSWLTQDPFKRVVLAFCTARPADGGPGSVYILLRKYRKKGKIYWERMPADPDLF